MPVKGFSIVILLLGGLLQPALAADLATLFTTPEERALIDRNRYGSTEIEPVREQNDDEDQDDDRALSLVSESVTREYVISGITVSRTGPHTVWINSVAYEDGARLDDDSRVEVLDGDQVRVRITAPDGKRYYATSGETLKVSIFLPAEVRR